RGLSGSGCADPDGTMSPPRPTSSSASFARPAAADRSGLPVAEACQPLRPASRSGLPAAQACQPLRPASRSGLPAAQACQPLRPASRSGLPVAQADPVLVVVGPNLDGVAGAQVVDDGEQAF